MSSNNKEPSSPAPKEPSGPSLARAVKRNDKKKGWPRFLTPFLRNQHSIDQDILNALEFLGGEQKTILKKYSQQQAVVSKLSEQLAAARQSLRECHHKMEEERSLHQGQMTAMQEQMGRMQQSLGVLR